MTDYSLGTFSNGPASWGMDRGYSAFTHITQFGVGIDIRPEPILGKHPPRKEPERFSGGVNLSAMERNHRRMRDAMVYYVLSGTPGVVVCAPWVAEMITKALKQ